MIDCSRIDTDAQKCPLDELLEHLAIYFTNVDIDCEINEIIEYKRKDNND